jgi:tape measure domain-containing protein
MQEQNTVKLRVEFDTSPLGEGKQKTISHIEDMGKAVKSYIGASHSELTAINADLRARDRHYEVAARSLGMTTRQLREAIRVWEQQRAAIERASAAEKRAIADVYVASDNSNKRRMESHRRMIASFERDYDAYGKVVSRNNQKMRDEADKLIKMMDKVLTAQSDGTKKKSPGFFKNLIGGGRGGDDTPGGLSGFLGGMGGGGMSMLGLAGGGLAIGAGFMAARKIQEGASAWLEYSANLEQARIGFTTLLGSAEAAQKHLDELQHMAVRTPFEFEELANASRLLQAMGVSAKEVVPLMTSIGNAVSAAGKGSEGFQRVVYAFGDIQAKGKLTGEEIRQLANNGIPVVKILSKELGVTEAQVLKLAERSKISAKTFNDAFKKYSDLHFGDAMEKQSKTFNGAMSNITDALKQKSESAFRPLFDEISKIAVKFGEQLMGADGLTGVLSAALGTLVEVGAKLAGAIISGLINPMNWIRAGVGIGKALAGGIYQGMRGLSNGLFGDHMSLDEIVVANMRANGMLPTQKVTNLKQLSGIAPGVNTLMQAETKDGLTEAGKEAQKYLQDLEDRKKKKGRKELSEVEQLSRKLKELNKDIGSFLAMTKEQFTLRIEVEDAERFKRDLESIITLRRELSLPLDDALPQNGKAASELIKFLESVKRVHDDVTQAENEARGAAEALAAAILTSQLPVLGASIRETISYTKYLRERRNEEEQLTADLNLLAKKRRDGLTDEANILRKVYTQLRLDILNENEDAKIKEMRSRLRRAIMEGSEETIVADLRRQLEVQVKQNAPTELKSIEANVQKITDALLKGKVTNPEGSDNRGTLGDGTGRSGSVSSGRFKGQAFNPMFAGGLEALFAEMEAAGLHPKVLSGVRSAEHQRSLWAKGRPTPYDGSPGNESPHQLGIAADIIFGAGERGRGIKMIADFVKANPEFNQAGFVKNRFGKLMDDRGHFGLDRAQIKKQHGNGQQQSGIDDDSNYTEVTKVSTSDIAKVTGAPEDTLSRLLNSEFDDRVTNLRESLNRLAGEAQRWSDEQYTAEYKALALEEARAKRRGEIRDVAMAENIQLDLLVDELNRAKSATADWQDEMERGNLKRHLEEANSLLREINQLQYDIANAGQNSSLKYEAAWLHAIREVQEAQEGLTERQIRAQVKIAEQGTFNAERARTEIMEQLSQAKGYTDIFVDGFMQASTAIGDAVGGLLGKVTSKLGAFGRILTDISSNLLRMVTNRLMMKVLDMILGGGGSTGATGGYSMPGIFGGGGGQGGFNPMSIITGGGSRGGMMNIGGLPINPTFFNGGGGGAMNPPGIGFDIINMSRPRTVGGFDARTFGISNATDLFDGGSSISDSETLTGRATTQSILDYIFGRNQGDGSPFKTIGSWGQMGLGLAQAAPLLGLTLGAGLGASLGKSSKLGSVLGGIGGGLLGGIAGLLGGGALISSITGVGAFSSFGALSGFAPVLGAVPFLAPIAGALLIGSYFIGRNSQRRADEKIRDAAATDALSQLDRLVTDVQRHRLDGSDALAQAAQIRQQYLDVGNQIKDKKTRNHHLQDVYRLDLKIANIKRAAEVAMNDNRRFTNRLPEFATGGIIPGQKGEPRLVLAHGGERITSLPQLAVEAAAEGSYAGIRGNSGASGRSTNLHVELSLGTQTQNQLFVNGAKSDKGYNIIIKQTETGFRKGDATV